VGMFRVEVQAVGGHGCQRNIKDGQQVQNFCGSVSCPDCITREYIRALKRAGACLDTNMYPDVKALLTHWPGQTCEVQDNLLTGVRKGSF
jgi:hypothetical protein